MAIETLTSQQKNINAKSCQVRSVPTLSRQKAVLPALIWSPRKILLNIKNGQKNVDWNAINTRVIQSWAKSPMEIKLQYDKKKVEEL